MSKYVSLEHKIRMIREAKGNDQTVNELFGSAGTAEMGQEGRGSNNRINPEYSSRTKGHGAASDTSRSKQAGSQTANKALKAEEFVDEGIVTDALKSIYTNYELKPDEPAKSVKNKPSEEKKTTAPVVSTTSTPIASTSGKATATFGTQLGASRVTAGKPKISLRAATNQPPKPSTNPGAAKPASAPLKVSSGGAKGKDLGLDPNNPEHAKLIAKIQAASAKNEEIDINYIVNMIIEAKKEDGAGKSTLGKVGDVADTAAEILVPGYDAVKKFKSGDYAGAAISGGIDVAAGLAAPFTLGGSLAARTAAKGAMKAGEKTVSKQAVKQTGKKVDNAVDIAGSLLSKSGSSNDKPLTSVDTSSAPTTSTSSGSTKAITRASVTARPLSLRSSKPIIGKAPTVQPRVAAPVNKPVITKNNKRG